MMEKSFVSRWRVPQIDVQQRWVAGVCAAIAREIGVQPVIIRASFVVLAVSLWGIILYPVCWVSFLVLRSPGDPYKPELKGATAFQRHLAVVMVVVGLVATFQGVTGGIDRPYILNDYVWPIGFIVAGSLIAWTKDRKETSGILLVARIVAGAAVAITGLILFGAAVLNSQVGLFALAVVVIILVGVGVVTGPTLLRMGQTLDEERLERIRADERAHVAAHLHDSVLQTLLLIQRNVDNPTKTVQLARQQERELRGWLYGPTPTMPGLTRLGPALEQIASEVEQHYEMPVEVVAVGDISDLKSSDIEGLLAAAREAIVNAAKHSAAKKVDVYAERSSDAIEVFVHDTGIGFVASSVTTDRRGIADSIVTRMERLGGSVTIESELGVGTDIEIRLPIQAVMPKEEP